MIRKQLTVAAGALPGALVAGLVLYQSNGLFDWADLPADDPGSRLAFAMRWLLVPGLALLVGVAAATRRAFIPTAIEGTRTPEHYGLEINLRYNQNTVEQVILAAIAWTGLALTLPVDRLGLIPAMAVLFAAGRLSFWVGYRFHPLGRAFGFVLTALPTLGAYAWLVWWAVS